MSMLILALFLLHAILGSFQMLGIGNTVLKTTAWATMGLIAVHAVIGVKLTADTLRVQQKAGVAYLKENQVFWARRISGFVIMILIFFHLTTFGYTTNGAYRLRWFDAGKLVTQLLLVAAVAAHVTANVKPMMISLGIKSLKQWVGDILFVLSVLLLFMAAAFIVYYLRWNVL